MISQRLCSLSEVVARAERVVCCFLAVTLVVLILLNVATRAVDIPLFWVDELAVYTMIWMALIGGSLLLHERRHVAVTLVTGGMSDNRQRAFTLVVDLLVVSFAAGLFAMCVAWYDPVGIAKYDFDIDEFAANTFNFIYQEPTNTLGLRKFWIWLVVPIVSMTLTLHALANLMRDLSKANLN